MHHVTRTLLRAPVTVAARTQRGTARLARGFARWITDARYRPVMDRAIESGRQKEVKAAREDRSQRIRSRIGALCYLSAITGPGLTAVHVLLWPYVWQTALAALTVTLFLAGGKPRSEQAAIIVTTEPGSPPALSADVVVSAFKSAMPPVKRAVELDPASLALVGPVRKDGPGWAVTVDLPPSVTTADCVRAREPIASALRVAGDQLYLSPGRHAGQCRLWVAETRPEDMPDVDWPHARQESLSLVEPVTIGATAKGEPVTLSLATRSPDGRTVAGGSMLVGGVSGSGKTTFMRLVVSAAALDPTATIVIFDGKGDGDYSALEPVCDWMRVGASPENLTDLHAMLVQAQAVMADRQKGLAPKTPLLIVIDEVQRVKDKDTQAVIEDLLRIGRSSGVFVVLATQKPSAETLPTDLRDSVRTRVCMKVHNQATNDMVLGTGAYSEGRDATKFTRGMGLILDVDTDSVDVVRVANVTDEIASRIAADHPRVPGRMFDQGPADEPSASFVDQVLAVWPGSADRAFCSEIAERLAEQGGAFWGWKAADVTRALKAAGVDVPAKVRIGDRTAAGVFRAALEGVRV